MPKPTIVSRKNLTVNQLVSVVLCTYINECSFWTNWWFAWKILIFKRTFYFVDFAHLCNFDSNLMKKWKIRFFFLFLFLPLFSLLQKLIKSGSWSLNYKIIIRNTYSMHLKELFDNFTHRFTFIFNKYLLGICDTFLHFLSTFFKKKFMALINIIVSNITK